MGMFIVKKGTKGLVIKKGKQWLDRNMKHFVTRKDNVFGKEELAVDPTGVSRHASVPSDKKTIGGWFAKNGHYAFLRDNYYLIVPGKDVIYG